MTPDQAIFVLARLHQLEHRLMHLEQSILLLVEENKRLKAENSDSKNTQRYRSR